MYDLTVIEGQVKFKINARDLHCKLESKQQFADWVKTRINSYGFEENEDYVVFQDSMNNPQGGRPSIEYHCTLGMAKEFCMLENNDIGKRVRKALIAMEERVSSMTQLQLMKHSIDNLIALAENDQRQDKRLDAIESNAVAREDIKKLVKDSLTTEQVNVFPAHCTDLENIRKKWFKGISESKISAFLTYIGHPCKEYPRTTQGNVVQRVLVYVTTGLEEARERLRRESEFDKNTPKNLQFRHPVLEIYRINKEESGLKAPQEDE